MAFGFIGYRRYFAQRAITNSRGFAGGDKEKPTGVVASFFILMIGILVFANWAAADSAVWMQIYQWKWLITAFLSIALGALLVWRWQWPPKQLLMLAAVIAVVAWLVPGVPELPFALGIAGLMMISALREKDKEWAAQSWDFAKQILPLLLVTILLNRP